MTEIRKEYYKNGNLKIETPYVNGKINGIEKEYREDGSLWFETSYVDGRWHGVRKEYDLFDGNVKVETPYINEKREGVKKDYYENGNLKSETPFVNNRRQGLAKEYDEDGNLKSETEYIEGKIHNGVDEDYHDNGNLKFEATVLNGKYNGDVQLFDKEGNIVVKIEYDEGAVENWDEIAIQLKNNLNVNNVHFVQYGYIEEQDSDWESLKTFEDNGSYVAGSNVDFKIEDNLFDGRMYDTSFDDALNEFEEFMDSDSGVTKDDIVDFLAEKTGFDIERNYNDAEIMAWEDVLNRVWCDGDIESMIKDGFEEENLENKIGVIHRKGKDFKLVPILQEDETLNDVTEFLYDNGNLDSDDVIVKEPFISKDEIEKAKGILEDVKQQIESDIRMTALNDLVRSVCDDDVNIYDSSFIEAIKDWKENINSHTIA